MDLLQLNGVLRLAILLWFAYFDIRKTAEQKRQCINWSYEYLSRFHFVHIENRYSSSPNFKNINGHSAF